MLDEIKAWLEGGTGLRGRIDAAQIAAAAALLVQAAHRTNSTERPRRRDRSSCRKSYAS
jgi:hypothetical protein